MRRAVFLVKNGIGYGHLRRAMLLAQALDRAGRLEPVIVSQAHTLDLLATSGVPVVNFPLLHRVASAVLEDAYLEVLDALLARLDPAVVIEDTYPDPRLAAIPSLRGRPRLLVMRRMDGASLDQVRATGRLVGYERILIAQTPEEFAREGHSPQTVTAVESTGRFDWCGPLYQAPAASDIERVRAKYSPDGAPLVVVNGGAGGDLYTDGWGDRFFTATAAAAARFAERGHPARFVLVTGPYYSGRELADTPNTTVVSFEPDLPALLAAADVAVLRGGANALAEALSGSARLILAPGASFMEGAQANAARIAADFGGAVIEPEADAVTAALKQAFEAPPRTRRIDPPNAAVDAVVAGIDELTAHRPHVLPRQLLLLIAGVSPEVGPIAQSLLPATGMLTADVDEAGVQVIRHQGTATCARVTPGPPRQSPTALAESGVRLLLSPSDSTLRGLERWQRLTPARRHLITTRVTTIDAATGNPGSAAHLIACELDAATSAAVQLDLSTLADHEAETYLRALADWLEAQPVRLVDTDAYLRVHSQSLLEAV